MPDYQKSKIYKLWSPSKNLVYYGSTTETISRRLSAHLYDYNKYNNNKTSSRYINSFKILECPDYKIELVELYPCNNRQQLCKKEGEYIRENECVNHNVAGRTSKEYCIENPDKIKATQKKFYDNNTEKRNKYSKEYIVLWRQENADKIREYQKKYRDANADKIREYQKKYRDSNK
jgi:hypothetical protein